MSFLKSFGNCIYVHLCPFTLKSQLKKHHLKFSPFPYHTICTNTSSLRCQLGFDKVEPYSLAFGMPMKSIPTAVTKMKNKLKKVIALCKGTVGHLLLIRTTLKNHAIN